MVALSKILLLEGPAPPGFKIREGTGGVLARTLINLLVRFILNPSAPRARPVVPSPIPGPEPIENVIVVHSPLFLVEPLEVPKKGLIQVESHQWKLALSSLDFPTQHVLEGKHPRSTPIVLGRHQLQG